MVWSCQDHDMVIIEYNIIMAWPSWKIAWSFLTDHGKYYNVIRTLVVQPTFSSFEHSPALTHVEIHLKAKNMLKELIRNFPDVVYWNQFLSQKLKITKKKTNSFTIYVLIKLLLNKNDVWLSQKKTLRIFGVSEFNFAD